MDSLFNDYPELLRPHEPPCLSLYQPTHRHHPENEQDAIRFRNLTKAIEERVRQQYSTRELGPLLDPFYALADNQDFWNHALDGLAVLSAPGFLRCYRLQRPVKELAIVADSFHTKPLLRIIQSADRYQILALSRKEIKLFEGNRDAVDEVALDARVPQTITDALGDELTDAHLAVASRATAAGRTPIRQGMGTKSDEVDVDAERFFRVVDRAVLEHHSRPSGLPLILAALPEHHALFRRVSANPFLAPQGIDVYPDALTRDALRERAWQVVAPRYLQRLQGLVETFSAAQARGAAGEDLAQVAEAATAGRIATLLIDADRQVRGRFDAASGRIEAVTDDDPLVDDVLDDLGEQVLKTGGEVVIVPAERMPVATGVAAIYRY
jgi:Bacterial archaeo-eukaryotic release factor family 3